MGALHAARKSLTKEELATRLPNGLTVREFCPGEIVVSRQTKACVMSSSGDRGDFRWRRTVPRAAIRPHLLKVKHLVLSSILHQYWPSDGFSG